MIYQPLLTGDKAYSASIIKRCSFFSLHRHVEIELMYIIDGQLDIVLEGKNYTAKEGELVFVGSRMSHSVSSCQSEHSFLLIEFGPVFAGGHFDSIGTLSPSEPILNMETHSQMKEIIPLFQEIISEKNTPTDESELIVSGNISKIAAYLYRALSEKGDNTPVNIGNVKSKMSVEKALDLITYHYNEDLTVESVAELMGYSVSNFCRIFKNAFGRSFHVLLNEARIKNACSMLYDTDLPIYQVAREVGFAEAKTFCRVFKSIKGCTPSSYIAKKCDKAKNEN